MQEETKEAEGDKGGDEKEDQTDEQITNLLFSIPSPTRPFTNVCLMRIELELTC